MKINEFGEAPKKNKNSQPIEEGVGSTLFGQHPVAAIKGMFTGKGTQATLEQDIFIKDFIGDAIASLDNGVKSGLVNPKIAGAAATDTAGAGKTGPQSVAGSRPASAPPGYPKAPAPAGTAPAPAGTAPAAPGKPGATVPGGTVPTVGQKPNVTGYSFKTTQQGQAPQAPLKPTTTNVKFNNMPTPKAGAPAAAPAAPKVAPKTYPQPNNKGTNAANKVPDDIQENSYRKLNAIFESILEATGGQSINSYMTAWFNKYMGGVDWQANKAQLGPLIQDIETTYSKDKGKAAIKRLAQAAYATAKTSGLTPDGAKDAVKDPAAGGGSGGAAPAAAAATPASSAAPAGGAAPAAAGLTMKDIRSALVNMKLRDLQSLKQTIDAVIASKAKQPAQAAAAGQEEKPQTQYMGKVAPNAGPATKPAAPANPLQAPTINPNKGTVTAKGTAPKGDITKGGTTFKESRRPRRR